MYRFYTAHEIHGLDLLYNKNNNALRGLSVEYFERRFRTIKTRLKRYDSRRILLARKRRNDLISSELNAIYKPRLVD